MNHEIFVSEVLFLIFTIFPTQIFPRVKILEHNWQNVIHVKKKIY